MYLHNDKDLFTEIITETNVQTGIAESIIEKDYYVTMILKLLAKSNPDIVFLIKMFPPDQPIFRRY